MHIAYCLGVHAWEMSYLGWRLAFVMLTFDTGRLPSSSERQSGEDSAYLLELLGFSEII